MLREALLAQNIKVDELNKELAQSRARLERATTLLREQRAHSEQQSLTVDALRKVASHAMSTVGDFGMGAVDMGLAPGKRNG